MQKGADIAGGYLFFNPIQTSLLHASLWFLASISSLGWVFN